LARFSTKAGCFKKAFRPGSAIRKSIIGTKKPDAPVLAVENYWESAAVD